jgi:hypothetical protein
VGWMDDDERHKWEKDERDERGLCIKMFLHGCKIARLDWGAGWHMHIRSFQAGVLFVTYHVE